MSATQPLAHITGDLGSLDRVLPLDSELLSLPEEQPICPRFMEVLIVVTSLCEAPLYVHVFTTRLPVTHLQVGKNRPRLSPPREGKQTLDSSQLRTPKLPRIIQWPASTRYTNVLLFQDFKRAHPLM